MSVRDTPRSLWGERRVGREVRHTYDACRVESRQRGQHAWRRSESFAPRCRTNSGRHGSDDGTWLSRPARPIEHVSLCVFTSLCTLEPSPWLTGSSDSESTVFVALARYARTVDSLLCDKRTANPLPIQPAAGAISTMCHYWFRRCAPPVGQSCTVAGLHRIRLGKPSSIRPSATVVGTRLLNGTPRLPWPDTTALE